MAGTGAIARDAFWKGLAGLVKEFAPRDRELLAVRDKIQGQIDEYHRARKGQAFDQAEYEQFLRDIGYVLPEPEDFAVRTQHVDDEIARIAGPQLVVPVSNARYALNAANARWGSLYDALYGTDAISGGGRRHPLGRLQQGPRRQGGGPRPRGARPGGAPRRRQPSRMQPPTRSRAARSSSRFGTAPRPACSDPAQFVGYQGEAASPSSVLLRHNNLHLDIRIDRSHPIGAEDPAGIADLVMESAVSTIMDLEDSVAAVDADDKVEIYRTWLGLMKGDLVESFEKGGRTVERRLNPDRVYTSAERRRAAPAWTQPHAGAQCGPPHVHRCGARRGRPRRSPRPSSMRPSPRSSPSTT